MKSKLHRSSHRAMGTIFGIIIFSDRDEYFLRPLTEELFENLDRYEESMSLFIDGSDVDYINRFASKRPVRVCPEVFEMIKISKYYSEITEGFFDITIGPLMKLWGFCIKRDTFPSEEEIKSVLEKVGYKNIVLNEDDRSIFLLKDGMMIDLGGIAKGWSVKKMAEKLRKFKIDNFLINAGTSSVYASGSPPDGKYWQAELPALSDITFSDEMINLKDNSVSVSGTYENIVKLGEHKFSHIVNPITGKPESIVVMTAVIGSDPLKCEVLSTAFSVMGIQRTKEFLKGKEDLSVIMIFFDEKNKLNKIKLAHN